MKVMTVIGARPQFVKAAVVSRQIAQTDKIDEILVHTGQHFDANMSDIFFQEMEIPKPDFHLEINSLGHGAMTGRMLEQLEALMLQQKPDVVMVYGDTNSTLAGALAAKKIHIPVAHVEAGLRSFDMRMPEEVNRILTDRISSLLCCPTEQAIKNLRLEGFDRFNLNIALTGDVMLDAARYYIQKAKHYADIAKNYLDKDYVLCTIHRAENTDQTDKLEQIVNALNLLNESIKVLLPLHPRTKKIIEQKGLKLEVEVLPPVGYFDMLLLLQHCKMVITDSGGLQKEAYFFKKNCVTLRDHTEWIELTEHGFNILANALDRNDMLQKMTRMLTHHNDFSINLYGEGNAGEIIVNALLNA